MEVTSELLSSFEAENSSSPVLNKNNVLSKFRVKFPSVNHQLVGPKLDNDGDYILQRVPEYVEKTIVLEHSVSTRLELVGQQLWRGALLLTDLVIHLRNDLAGATVIELGAGVGLTSIVAATFASTVIATDLDAGDILKLLKGNIERNKQTVIGGSGASVHVEALDWFNTDWPPHLQTYVEKASIIIAADVVYDDKTTEAFLKTITKILSTAPKKTLYIALEKRYVFTMADLDSVAPCYEHLMKCIDELRGTRPWCNWTITSVPIDFPQTIAYERFKQLVIIKITS